MNREIDMTEEMRKVKVENNETGKDPETYDMEGKKKNEKEKCDMEEKKKVSNLEAQKKKIHKKEKKQTKKKESNPSICSQILGQLPME